MEKLQKDLRWYFVSATLLIIIGALLSFIPSWSFPMPFLLLLILLTSCVLIGLGLRKTVFLRDARLITENEIFQTSPVMLAGEDGNPVSDPETKIVVSCFGILINSRVIWFNRKANRLWRVEIGQDFLKLVYGTKTNQKQMILLHEPINTDTMHRLAERFRVETGAKTVLPDSFHA